MKLQTYPTIKITLGRLKNARSDMWLHDKLSADNKEKCQYNET